MIKNNIIMTRYGKTFREVPSESAPLPPPERNYGVDLLRLVSMFMVVVLHILGKGGILSTTVDPKPMWTVWTIETMCYCAVDVFALISGYVGFRSPYKPKKLLELWLRTIFWTLLSIPIFLLIFGLPKHATVGKYIFSGIMPISTGSLWYIAQYSLLMVFKPVLDLAIQTIRGKKMTKLLMTALLLVSFDLVAVSHDAFRMTNGYSFAWLMVLYLFGGLLGRHELLRRHQRIIWIIAYIVCVAATVVSIYFMRKHNAGVAHPSVKSTIMLSYVSPTILVCAVSLLGIFANLKIPEFMQPIIGLFTPCALGVYIIHTQPIVYDELIRRFTESIPRYSAVSLTFRVLLLAAEIYIICLLLDLLRHLLFKFTKKKLKAVMEQK